MQAKTIVKAFEAAAGADNVLSEPADLATYAYDAAVLDKVMLAIVVLGTFCARLMSPLIGDRHFRPLAETPFHKMMPSLDTQAGASRCKVAFYVGCLADKTFDIHQFLVSELGITGGEAGEADTPVTYHDPCHLKKSLKVWTEPRTLINASRGYRLKEMAESDWCCAMGGSFNLQYYPISGRIGDRKRDHIRSTGCRIVATGCPACMLQLSDSLSKAGDAIQVKHPVELYAESLKRP